MSSLPLVISLDFSLKISNFCMNDDAFLALFYEHCEDNRV